MSIATYEQPANGAQLATATRPAVDAAVMRLTEWAQSAQAAHRVATSLVGTSFVPQQFRGKPDEATAAILAGLEVGLSPMSALRAFDIIQGTAAPRAITLRAVVQSHGHEMVLEETTTTRCRMKGRRKGSDEWQRVTWTLDRARDLGLTSKDNWKKQPAAMLVARATSELARLIASDAILGIGYSSEEVADGVSFEHDIEEQTTTPAPSTGTRRMSRKKAPSEPQEPAEDAETPAAEAEPQDAPEASTGGITPAQSKKLHACFNDLGVTDREMRLLYVNNVIGRAVESSNDLTKDEAGQVLDALDADLAVRDQS